MVGEVVEMEMVKKLFCTGGFIMAILNLEINITAGADIFSNMQNYAPTVVLKYINFALMSISICVNLVLSGKLLSLFLLIIVGFLSVIIVDYYYKYY